MNTKTKIKHLINLNEGPGWAVLREVMNEEILMLAMSVAKSPKMSQQEQDFHRGAILSAERLLELPTRLIQKLEGDLALEHANDPRQGRDNTETDL